jgi:Rap1a immunity proteins
MKKVLFLCLLLVLVAAVGNSQELATGKTTAEFLKMCEFVLDDDKRPENFPIAYMNTGMCFGYISGFLDSIPLFQYAMPKKVICLPTSGVRAADVFNAMAQQLKKDPSMLKETVRAIMFTSLRAEYPCQ